MYTTASVDWCVDWPTARFATNRSAVHRSCAPLLIGRDRGALERRSCLLMIKYLSSWSKSLNLNSGIEPKIYIRSISNSICLAFCNIRHISYLSILVHRHIIKACKKYAKKHVNLLQNSPIWSKFCGFLAKKNQPEKSTQPPVVWLWLLWAMPGSSMKTGLPMFVTDLFW